MRVEQGTRNKRGDGLRTWEGDPGLRRWKASGLLGLRFCGMLHSSRIIGPIEGGLPSFSFQRECLDGLSTSRCRIKSGVKPNQVTWRSVRFGQHSLSIGFLPRPYSQAGSVKKPCIISQPNLLTNFW